MGALDFVLTEVESKYGINQAKAGSLVSSLLGFINQHGGPGGMLDMFRQAGLSDTVTSWLSGNAQPVSAQLMEGVLGRSAIDGMASRAGIPFATAASALGMVIPKLVQKLAPGGVIPTRLPAEFMSYLSGPTAAVASGARQAVYAAEETAGGLRRYLWPLLALLAAVLLGFWLWGRSSTPGTAVFNVADQVRIATQKATSALGALKPGFGAQDLISALNLGVINFPTASAQIPPESTEYLNMAAAAIKNAPAGTVIEIDGHTDNTGDASANLQLSQQRADAVRDYLVGQGVSATSLITKGFGDTKPIASNDSEEGKFRNRRIEFAISQ
jgi:outer membrane protein OmpA-like peptidoglycan-associated protein/uncharacterized protein YidB (DUF937 family)